LQTHAPKDAPPSLFGPRQPWRAAREIIDWSIQGRSIFGREKPLAENTLRRIAAGARKFWGVDLEPFLVPFHGWKNGDRGRPIALDRPLPTLTTEPRFGLVQPFVLGQQSGATARPVSSPIP